MINSTPLLFLMLKACLLLGMSTASQAEFYYWKTADGSLMATDQPPPEGIEFRTGSDLQTINQWQNVAIKKTAAADPATDVEKAQPANTNSVDVQTTETDMITVKLSPTAPPQEITPEKIEDKSANTTAAGVDDVSIGATSELPTREKEELTAANLQPDDEAGCQKLYGMNCDKVFNWRKYGEKYCEEFKNERCSDEGWFERRFKPLTLDARHQRTLRNAAARNRANDDIRQYLLRKYTGICAKNPEKSPERCDNPVYDTKIRTSFEKLDSKEKGEIRRLQAILKESQDRNLTDRAIEELLSYLPWATAADL